MSWNKLEAEVRLIAGLRYGQPAEQIRLANGVSHDCVCKLSPKRWVIVEITKHDALDKIRGDVTRLILTRQQLFTKNHIMCECAIVVGFEPTPAMRDAAEENGIDIYSASAYIAAFFDQRQYNAIREAEKFGSAVDIISGEPDRRPYIPVKYDDKVRSKSYDIIEISSILLAGVSVVLTGSFGSGKSRCYKEIFDEISKKQDVYVISIDLRDIGALSTANQIIRAHFENIGLDSLADSAIRLSNNRKLIVLLDGFDEMGGAQWSDDPKKLSEIRRRTLKPIREIAKKSYAVFISGRDHYFNSDGELIEAVGLGDTKHLRLECRSEFSAAEIRQFLQSYSIDTTLPEWLPRRPLLYQIVVELQSEGFPITLDRAEGHAELWGHIATLICRREARINANFEEDTIFSILKRLGRMSRKFLSDVEPVTLENLRAAYKSVRGFEPADEDAVLLQKLPGLGRISYDSKDRRFVDSYLVDGFRGSDLVDFLTAQDEDLSEENWINSLDSLGLSIVGKKISEQANLSTVLSFAKRFASRGNSVLAADLISAIGFSDFSEASGGGMSISGAEIRILDLSQSEYRDITFDACIIRNLQLADYETSNLIIKNCIIENLAGVTGEKGVPKWVTGCEIQNYAESGNIASIKNLKLAPPLRILLVILHKTFFQAGRGRQEEALLRGLGQVDRAGNTKDIIRLLVRDGFLTVEKGRHGNLYIPNLVMKPAASRIINLQSQCGEQIWEDISSLKS